MIESSLSNPTLIVAVTVALGFVFLLGTLLVPSEPILQSRNVTLPEYDSPLIAPRVLDEESFTPPPAAPQTFMRTVYVESEKIEAAIPPEVRRPPAPDVAPAPARVVRSTETAAPPRNENRTPVERPETVQGASPAPARRMTWTSLVDESADELDLPTRLKIIEALGLVGGSWSREILARAYEQELDATVRGAIFLALRDSKSAA